MWDQVVVPLPPPLEALQQLVALEVLPRRHQRRKKRKKRVRIPQSPQPWLLLIPNTEKEESDEDMGFGLFD